MVFVSEGYRVTADELKWIQSSVFSQGSVVVMLITYSFFFDVLSFFLHRHV